jgi:hypothetical protein
VPIEDWISDPVASERHQRVIDAPPDRALELALSTPLDADRVSWALMRFRGLPGEGTLEDFLTGGTGFVVLQRDQREFVFGIATRVWKLRPGGPTLRDPAEVGTFSAEPVPERGRSLLVTETQVEAVDDEARRKFRAYWLVVEPFSRLIRRRWLRAIEKRAREAGDP